MMMHVLLQFYPARVLATLTDTDLRIQYNKLCADGACDLDTEETKERNQ